MLNALYNVFHVHSIYIDWVAYKQLNLFLTVWKAEKSKIKAPADSMPGESPFPGS